MRAPLITISICLVRVLTLLQIFLLGILLTGLLPDMKTGAFVCMLVLMMGGVVVLRELRPAKDRRVQEKSRPGSLLAYVRPLTGDSRDRIFEQKPLDSDEP